MKHIKAIACCIKIYAVCSLIILQSGCKKALELGPSVSTLTGDNVYTTNSGAQGALSGLFSLMVTPLAGPESLSIRQGLSADELTQFGVNNALTSQFYTNDYSTIQDYYWSQTYKRVYFCNTAIAGITTSSTITDAVKQQMLGELKFVRAFTYFYAYNIYGNIPMPLTNDYAANSVISRSPQETVQQQIIRDLKEAQGTLPDGKYLTGTNTVTTERVRPNKQVATAMLSRTYLYMKDWVNAEAQSTEVINSSLFVLEPNLNQVFLKGSREAIWQLAPVEPGINNREANTFVLTVAPSESRSELPLSSSLVQSFEAGDGRFTNWVGKYNAQASGTVPARTYFYAFKYKNYIVNSTDNPITEYPILLRLAEQYLIRAEARAQQGNVAGAVADLNLIRKRARGTANDLPDFSAAISQADCLAAIARERRIELFTEQGHRWFDLKRTGQINAVMENAVIQKGGTWSPYKQILPIPASEITLNRNLTQNPGY
jgi:hypothetical protein